MSLTATRLSNNEALLPKLSHVVAFVEEDFFCDVESLPPTLRWDCFESCIHCQL